MLLTMCARTRRCSPLFNQLRLRKRCTWETLPPPKSKAYENVVLKMTFEKELTLTNVLYVLEIQKNLVSGSLLNNHGFRLIFKSNKFVLSKSEMYVGKGYLSDGMWKLNVMTIIKSNMNKVSTFTYVLESSNIWYGRLGHVNYDTLHRLCDAFNLAHGVK